MGKPIIKTGYHILESPMVLLIICTINVILESGKCIVLQEHCGVFNLIRVILWSADLVCFQPLKKMVQPVLILLSVLVPAVLWWAGDPRPILSSNGRIVS